MGIVTNMIGGTVGMGIRSGGALRLGLGKRLGVDGKEVWTGSNFARQMIGEGRRGISLPPDLAGKEKWRHDPMSHHRGAPAANKV